MVSSAWGWEISRPELLAAALRPFVLDRPCHPCGFDGSLLYPNWAPILHI